MYLMSKFYMLNEEKSVKANVLKIFLIVKATLIDRTTDLFISGSDFTDTFNLQQFHFHWGWNDYQGSEHRINFKEYPLEVIII